MLLKPLNLLLGLAFASLALPAAAQHRGPSTTTAPYIEAVTPGLSLTSLLTVGDRAANGYRMVGIPDGLGAYDNGDGTITVLMNHELGAALGAVRAHGAKGAFVSEWVIDKKTLTVLKGDDLMRRVMVAGPQGQWTESPATAFARFCSADLAEPSAFWHRASHKGTRQRIFLNGEESGAPNQRGLAHVATGPDKGTTYVLPWATPVGANGAWENLLAYPHGGERTVVMGNADGGTNGVYVYVGEKRREGNAVERAGLVGGELYRVAVAGNRPETRDADAGLGLEKNPRSGVYEGRFSLTKDQVSTNASATAFLRPEDGAWDKRSHNRYYFVTTDRPDAAKDGELNPDIPAGQVGRSRLWALDFDDASTPELGGTIRMLLDGSPAQGVHQMLDNLTVSDDGSLILMEDVGNNAHNGKIWHFEPRTSTLTQLTRFDSSLFGDLGSSRLSPLVGSLTKDEETSGVIDVTELFADDEGDGNDGEDDVRVSYHLLVVQNHAASPDAELVEGGQLLLMKRIQRQADEDGHRGERGEDRHGRGRGDHDKR